MTLLDTLQKLGLSEREAAVYLAGLELGPASIKSLAIKSKVKRTTIYQLIDDLKEKGLFRETVVKKKPRFIAAHPNQLKIMLNAQNDLLERSFDNLLAVTNTDLGKPSLELYDTVDGVHKMYLDALKEADCDTIGVAGDEAVEGLNEEWLEKYVQKRKRAGLSAKTIMNDSPLARRWQKKDKEEGRELRLVKKSGEIPVNIEVVGDRVLISSLKGEVIGLTIKSTRIAVAFRSVLETLWKKE